MATPTRKNRSDRLRKVTVSVFPVRLLCTFTMSKWQNENMQSARYCTQNHAQYCWHNHPLAEHRLLWSRDWGLLTVVKVEGVHGVKRAMKFWSVYTCLFLCRWLLETYGDSFLRAGSGILDVGAGAGELAFQLHNLNDLPVIALDPRPLQVRHFCKSYRRDWHCFDGTWHQNPSALKVSPLLGQDSPSWCTKLNVWIRLTGTHHWLNIPL